MNAVIDERRNEDTTAFAHCISKDFDHDRHMSKGVAVVFKKKYGKPFKSDCINAHLAYQKNTNEAGVYSLLTKENYDCKPKPEDYDRAFDEFTKDFKKRGFKHLICSPMGCVRDKISLSQFTANIVKFQSKTAASIEIIAL